MDKKSLEELNKKLEKTPDDIGLLLERIEILFNIEKYDDALLDLNKAIKINPNDVDCYNNRGLLYNKLSEYDKALANYNKAIEINPNNAVCYNNRGNLYNKINKYDEALANYNKAIEINPNYANCYYNRGILYQNLNKFDNALADYNKAIKINPNIADYYYNRGCLYVNLNKYRSALVNYNKAIKINPIYIDAYYNRGLIYKSLCRYEDALANFDKVIEINPNYTDAYNDRGDIYYNQNEYEKASTDINKAIEIDSTYEYKFGNKEKLETIENILTAKEPLSENLRIKIIKTKIEDSNIEDSIKQVRQSFNTFLKEPGVSLRKDSPIDFIVLRRWNSYTPIIADNFRSSKGGGYFIRIDNCGIVIDPGFNFIDNFKTAGYKFHEIDHVLITHAHNDHTTDLESILTLLYKYNEEVLGGSDSSNRNSIIQKMIDEQKPTTDEEMKRIEKQAKEEFLKSPRRKRLRLYMSVSTYKKYLAILNLNSDADYDVIIIKADDELPLTYPNPGKKFEKAIVHPKITAIGAKHFDTISDKDSLGFVVDCKDFVLVYTGDTGFDMRIKEQYDKIYEKYKNRNIILLAHLGGFKEYERSYDTTKDIEGNKDKFYKYHLGRFGLAKVVEILKPKICIISEFGEEFRDTRIELTNIYQEVYQDTTYFIPADIGLHINEKLKVKLIYTYDNTTNTYASNFFDYTKLDICELGVDNSLHYYNNEIITDKSKISSFLTNKYNLELFFPKGHS